MAKKLLQAYYEYDSASGTLTVPKFVKHEELLIVTNVTLNTIVYNFADDQKGATVTWDPNSETTTIVLDSPAPGSNNVDKFQIFVDEPEQKMDVSDSLLDPVHKLRVSNPQNLIDTDFEYGLQPTKWETLELSNNIPSTYIGDGQGYLSDVLSVTARTGSDVITVTTQSPHGLDVGVPIDVQGLSSRTAEGKYIIKFVTETTFSYNAASVQTVTGTISGLYTQIAPGKFFNGSQISYREDLGISTTEGTQSTLTVTTPTPHGFQPNSNFYLVNSIGRKTFEISNVTSSTAPDGDRYVHYDDFIATSVSPNLQLTETKKWIPPYNVKFSSGDINVNDNTITWESHDLRTNDCVIYQHSAGDTAIGGLTNFQIYYVIYKTADTISLSNSYNGSEINITSTGTFNYGRALLGLVYEIYQGRNTGSYTFGETTYRALGTGSGWDAATYDSNLRGYFKAGISNATNVRSMLYVSKNGTDAYRALNVANLVYYPIIFSSSENANYILGQTGTVPGGYNFIENGYGTSESFYNQNSLFYSGQPLSDGTFRAYIGSTTYRNNAFTSYGHNDFFMVPLIQDPEADSFYVANHGAVDDTPLTITYNSGNIALQNFYSTQTTTTTNWLSEVLSEDRIRLKNTSGVTQRLSYATGSYTFDVSTEDPNRNTFYNESHGLVDGQNVVFSLGTGGVVPTTATGIVDTAVPNTSRTKYDAINTAMETYLGGLSGIEFIPTPTINDWNAGRVLTTDPTWWGNSFNQIYFPYNLGVSRYTGGNFQGSVSVNIAGSLGLAAATDGFSPVNDNVLFSDFSPNFMTKDLTSGSHYGWMLQYDVNPLTSYLDRSSGGDWIRIDPLEIRILWSNPSPSSLRNGRNFITTTSNGSWYCNITTARLARNGGQVVLFGLRAYPAATSTNYNYMYQFTLTGSTYNGLRQYDALLENGIQVLGFFQMSNTADFDSTTEFESFGRALVTAASDAMTKPTVNDGDTYGVIVTTPNRFRLTKDNVEVDITNSGTETLQFATAATPGVLDGAYTAASVADTLINFNTNVLVSPIDYSFDSSTVLNDTIPLVSGDLYHHLVPGSLIAYDAKGNSPIGGLSSGSQYYTIPVDDQNIQVANTYENAINGLGVTLTAATGTHEIQSESISGYVKMPGTCELVEGQDHVFGTSTLFTRYFKPGDTITFRVETAQSVGSFETYVVSGITSDTELTLTTSAATSEQTARAYTTTKVYARPDGYAVHRPFDGGVEIAAGTAPFSQILRQTRKYFRYQSGKGIQTSLAINFNPPTIFQTLTAAGTTVTGKTTYPHRMSTGQSIKVKDSTDTTYNGIFTITKVDDFTFTFVLPQTPATSIPSGIIKYNLNGYSGSAIRSGMFDFQNGFFFEYDGNTVYCVRRSSTTQLSGSIDIANRSNEINGTDTNFTGQLTVGDFVVIRGQTHKITKIESRTKMYVQPEYRGVSASKVILTKTEDLKIPQIDWNIDRCDGSGPEGFLLDINAIQMCYMDYSWYGAGKIRFGFKDTKGHVRYVHEFIHNNRLDEAYMRSGNLPAKYEIINDQLPTYAPTLFHWGTSVIMDGKFDEDEAYLFTAESQTFNFTGGDSATVTTNGAAVRVRVVNYNTFQYDYYLQIPFNTSTAGSFGAGTIFETSTGILGDLESKPVVYTDYSNGNFNAYLYVASRAFNASQPKVPSVPSGTVITIGGGAAEENVSLGNDLIPLVSLRLAPSVDSNLTGLLGQRDIINRMQLKLAEVGLVLTHDCTVKLLLNANLSTTGWENVRSPSLSQLYEHSFGETIDGGAEVFSFRAAGGTKDSNGKRITNATNFSLAAVVDMGNSILGGDGVFPNGPDILTVAVTVNDTSDIRSTNPFQCSARITWSESQA